MKVSTSKKSIATVKAVKKNKKVVSYKVSAKKAGKATITIKVKKGTYKGTYKCKVTVKKKVTPKVTPKPTAKASSAPATDTPVTDAPATDTPATDTPATDVPATETPTEEPTATPAVKAIVESASNITADGNDLIVALTLKESVSAADLKDAKITLTGAKTVTATFKELDADGKAVFVIDDASALKPGDTSANGEYAITSDSLTAENIKTEYEEALAGNAIAGYVVKLGSDSGISHAKVTVEGGQSVYTDDKGYYRIPATNGKKKVTVEADGYLDYVTSTRVDVNRNHVTSHNFQLKEFDVSKINVKITAKDGAAAVEGAAVTIKRKSDGKVVAGNAVGAADESIVTAATTGLATYGNSGSNVSGGPSVMIGTAENELFVKGETYVISVSKKLAKDNLLNVYAEQTEEFTVTNKHDYEFTIAMTKTKKIPSFTINKTYKDAAAKTAIDNSNTMKATYQIFTTVNGKLEEVVETTAEVTEAVSNDSASIDLTKVTPKPLEDATLPSGSYYVVITPTGVGTPAATPAICAIKVTVKEGEAATGNATLENGTSRQISTDVNLGENEATALGGKDSFDATSGSETTLEAVNKEKTAGTAASSNIDWDGKTFGKLGTKLPVKVAYEIGQVMDDGVVIPVTPASMTTGIDAKWSGSAFIANGECKTLLSNAKYDITSAGTYLLPQTQKGVTLDKDNVTGRTPFTTKAAWNLAKAVVDVTADSDILTAGTSVNSKHLKLIKFDVLDASTKEVKASREVNIAGPDVAIATDGTAKLAFDLDLAAAGNEGRAINLPAGNYIVEYTLENTDKKIAYKAVASAPVKMIGLEQATVETTAKVEKATADTKISGKISVRKDDGTVDSSFNFVAAKGLAVLLDANKKIAGFGEVNTATGAYSIEDGAFGGSNMIVGGKYTLVIRMYGAETVAETVEIKAGESVDKDIETKVGGNGVIKALVRDTNQNPLVQPLYSVPVAYDEYYVVPNTANYVSGKPTTLKITSSGWNLCSNHNTYEENDGTCGNDVGTAKYNVGLYYLSNGIDGYKVANGENILAEWNKLSAGKYSVCMGVWNANENAGWDWTAGDKDTYKFKTEHVTIKNTGDKVYPEWTYEKVSGAGNVNVSVKFDSSVHAQTDSYSTTGGTSYAILVRNADGSTAFQKIYQGNSTATLQQTISLPSHKTYTVELYTMSGKQVSQASLTTQGVDTSVTMALNDADAD